MIQSARKLSVWLPALTFLLVALAAFASWFMLERFEQEAVRLKTDLTVEQVGIRLDEYVHTRLAVVGQMGQLRKRGQLEDETAFSRHANGLMEDFPGLLAINWVDPDGIIRWVVPAAANRKARGRDLKSHPDAGATFLDAMRSGERRVTPPIDLYQGGRGMAAYLPLIHDGVSRGYLNVVFRLVPIIESCLEKGVRSNFHFAVLDGDELIYSFGDAPEVVGDPRRAEARFGVGQRTWRVILAPRASLVASTATAVDEVGLAISLLGGLLLAGALRRFLVGREALRRSELRYRQLVESMSEGLGVLDADARFSYVNPPLETMLGCAPGALLGRDVFTLADDRDAALMRRQFAARREGSAEPYEMSWRHQDGRAVPTLVSPTPLFDADGMFEGSLAVISDLTQTKREQADRERLEEQLRQAQKLEAIGRLAGGVAHDFNNILTGVIGFSEIMLMDMDEGTEFAEYARQIGKTAERGARLTRQLLAFSRRQVIEPKILDLKVLIGDAEAMLRRVLGENVEITFSVAADIWNIEADAGQIDQILLNLVVNARDALADGGRISVSAGNACSRLLARDDAPGTPADYVVLDVADDGRGMDAETMANIFEPFFTTKEQGRGTGLGLATVYGIVKQNGGDIDVESAPNAGSRFRVYLPRASAARAFSRERSVGEEAGGDETILLVEDEDAVREPVRQMLRSRGYDVLAAASGEEALEVCRARSGPIHLLLTDVMMPGMDGRALAVAVAESRPNIATLFMSGHVDDVLADRGVLQDGVRLLEKPFSSAELAAKVREVLNENHGSAPT